MPAPDFDPRLLSEVCCICEQGGWQVTVTYNGQRYHLGTWREYQAAQLACTLPALEQALSSSLSGGGKPAQVMSRIDLKHLTPGDLVEYQQPVSKKPAQGTFQRWYSLSDGQARLIVRSQQLGADLPIDPQWVIRITRPSKGHS
jgi:hypothetical protein